MNASDVKRVVFSIDFIVAPRNTCIHASFPLVTASGRLHKLIKSADIYRRHEWKRSANRRFNPLKGRDVNWLHLAIQI